MKKSNFLIVRKKGVVILPKRIRKSLKIEEGDPLRIEINDGKIVLSKEDFWGKLFNCARGLYDPDEAELELDVGE
ncbi:MAG: AbrB/MazE/SpoVT family DNA-binding domain-containing protein [Candidatus Methanomethylicia archaeon]